MDVKMDVKRGGGGGIRTCDQGLMSPCWHGRRRSPPFDFLCRDTEKAERRTVANESDRGRLSGRWMLSGCTVCGGDVRAQAGQEVWGRKHATRLLDVAKVSPGADAAVRTEQEPYLVTPISKAWRCWRWPYNRCFPVPKGRASACRYSPCCYQLPMT